jgi:hypothetical protein
MCRHPDERLTPVLVRIVRFHCWRIVMFKVVGRLALASLLGGAILMVGCKKDQKATPTKPPEGTSLTQPGTTGSGDGGAGGTAQKKDVND